MADLKKELLDKIRRAQEMEESMAATLIDLCQLNTPIQGIEPNQQKQLIRILEIIKNDTLKHKKIISEIKETL